MTQKKKIQASVTLDEDQLDWIDREIAENRFANRSHAIVYALTRLIKEDYKASDKGNGEPVPAIA